MGEPKVSIIVPVYNQERYLGKCLRSIVSQTYKNLEIIVINDGSTDKSLSIIQKWAQKDIRIRTINKINEGASRARKDGYRIATGEFVTPVDSDDLLPRDAIEILVRHIVEKDVDVVLGSMTRFLGIVKKKHAFDGGDFPFHTIVRQPELFDKYYQSFYGKPSFPIMMAGRLYKKRVIDNALKKTNLCTEELPFVGEDHFFNMQLFPHLMSMYRTDETVYFYRYGGLSTGHFSPSYPDLFKLADIRLELLDRYSLDNCIESLLEEYSHSVYYHAQQLLEYKKSDKDGLIAFFSEEMSKRKIAKKLIDYYADKEAPLYGMQIMARCDYEAMYNHASKLMNDRCGSFKNKSKKILLWLTKLVWL